MVISHPSNSLDVDIPGWHMTLFHAVIERPSSFYLVALPSPKPPALLHPPDQGEGDPDFTRISSTHGPLPRISHVVLTSCKRRESGQEM